MGGPQSADKKSVRAAGPRDWNPDVFDQARCSRILRAEFALNNRGMGQGRSVREKSVRANGPILVARAIRNPIRANRFARIIRNETPIFLARQADSQESLEFLIRANHPIRANRANRFARITPLKAPLKRRK